MPSAIYLLAVLTEQGVGVAREPAVAAQLYRHAAERGQRAAQLRWGVALLEGRDVAQDVVEGESWLRRAALSGDPVPLGGAKPPPAPPPPALRKK